MFGICSNLEADRANKRRNMKSANKYITCFVRNFTFTLHDIQEG